MIEKKALRIGQDAAQVSDGADVALRRFWTAAEEALLRAMYPHCHTADVAEWVGRTQGKC